jgi:hypothetical protein
VVVEACRRPVAGLGTGGTDEHGDGDHGDGDGNGGQE